MRRTLRVNGYDLLENLASLGFLSQVLKTSPTFTMASGTLLPNG